MLAAEYALVSCRLVSDHAGEARCSGGTAVDAVFPMRHWGWPSEYARPPAWSGTGSGEGLVGDSVLVS
jgi:hypothetical protein